MEDFLTNEVINRLLDYIKVVRNQTKKLVECLEIDDQVIQTANYVSPIKWHLGHTSWFFEKFILAKYCKNYKFFNEEYDFIFNSFGYSTRFDILSPYGENRFRCITNTNGIRRNLNFFVAGTNFLQLSQRQRLSWSSTSNFVCCFNAFSNV